MADATKVVVRRVSADDNVLSQIAVFRCADQAVDHQVEVEQWIQDHLASWAFAPGASDDEPQLLATLDVDTGGLIGLFAHEHAWLQSVDAKIAAEKIALVAVALDYQSKRDGENRRYSDIVMGSGLRAIELRRPPARRVFCKVHVDNEASFRLLGRHDMSRRIAIDPMTELVTH